MNLKELRDLRNNLGLIITNHERLRHSYFWSPGFRAGQRRANEERNNMVYNNARYAIQCNCNYSESCRHCYYRGEFYVEGKKVTIRTIKNIVKALECII